MNIYEEIDACNDVEKLDLIINSARDKRAYLLRRRAMSVTKGDAMRVVGDLRPKYLLGSVVTVNKVNKTTIDVTFPDDPTLNKWSGGRARVPMSSLEPVA